MKIYTKTGDEGETGLFGGARVPKDDARVAAYGDVDELNAAIGLARALDPRDFADALLQSIQRDPSDVAALEDAIDEHEARLAPLKNFILPGGAPKAATLHLARTVCRRAERTSVALSRHQNVSPAILQYLNRLSDLLFVLARAANAQAGHPDVKW